MSNHGKRSQESPLAILAELAVEGTSSLVEAQRTLLGLAQQENEIILNGVKQRVDAIVPAAAMTDLVRRSLEALLGMQQELLTTTSRQSLQWIEAERSGKGGRATRVVEFAREGIEAFARAQNNLLQAIAQESARATGGRREESSAGPKVALRDLAREASAAFIEAQKRLLDVMGQQMTVNLDASGRALELISPSKLFPIANRTGDSVREFLESEKSLFEALIKPAKKISRPRSKRRARSRAKTAAVRV